MIIRSVAAATQVRAFRHQACSRRWQKIFLCIAYAQRRYFTASHRLATTAAALSLPLRLVYAANARRFSKWPRSPIAVGQLPHEYFLFDFAEAATLIEYVDIDYLQLDDDMLTRFIYDAIELRLRAVAAGRTRCARD